MYATLSKRSRGFVGSHALFVCFFCLEVGRLITVCSLVNKLRRRTMKRTLHMWAVFLVAWGGACVYGSSDGGALDPLEGPLRTCCAAAGAPDTYEDVRRRIETFHTQIPGKTTTLTRLALMEECFLPQWLAQELGLVHLRASRDAAKVQEDIHTWHYDKGHGASAPTALFLKNIGMTQEAFTALAYKDQLAKFDASNKAKTHLLSRSEGDVPHMIWESALHHYNRERDPHKFALLYYTFMACEADERLGIWQSLVAIRACEGFAWKGFEFYGASDTHMSLKDALLALPHVPFPYPEEVMPAQNI
ncbi:MAG: hypothetical protein C0514_07095 [Candidatus Puniceispirillum sp.]|nr:hypothetical protein [Candidatus Puniceispirillum sp.]